MFYRSKALKKELGESTFRTGIHRYPDCWHEGHAPKVKFLIAQQLHLAVDHPQK